uniref:Uncharacterized protein n=1 Tax=viral metagenome TaxID=1070528 RepID=A0A6C0J7G9_9ZZZZ
MESFFNSTDEDKILTTNSTWNYPTFNKENVQRYDSVSVTITTSYPIDSGIYLRWSTDGTIWILGETYSTDSTHLNAVNNLYERTIVRDHRAKFFHIYVENTNGSDNTVCVQTIYKYNQQEIDIGATFNNGRMLVDTSLNDIGNIVDTSYKNTDIGAMALAVRSDVLDAIVTDTGDYTPLQVNASGALYVTGTQYEEDTEHLSGATGTMSLAVRSDVLDAIVTDTGDYTPLQVNASGALYVTGTQYEEDTEHLSGATGTMSLAVRSDVLDAIVTDTGDYTPLQVNASGALYVTGTQYQEDTEHLPGATGTMSLAIRTDVLDATPAVNGAYRPLQVDACGSLYVTGGGGTQYAEDTIHLSGAKGTMSLAIRSDILDAIVTDTGDYTPLQVDASGSLYVTGGGGTQYTEDTIHLSGATGTMSLAVRSDILDAIVTDTGDYTPLQVDASGALYVTGTQYEEDTEHLPGATGTMSLAVRTDVLDATPAVNGAYRPLQVDACGSLYVTSSLPIGAATSIKQDIGNADLATLAATVSAGAVAITSAIPLEVKSIVAVGEWLSSAPLAAATYSTELNVSAYKSVRLIGKWATEITQMQIFGSQTTEGTYYSLGAENVLLGQTVTISGTTEYHTSAVIENTPPFLKLYNSEVSSVTLEVDYCAYAN